MRQVVAYKRLKIMGNYEAISPETCSRSLIRRWSFTRSSNCKALTGKFLVLEIGGFLWEAIGYERSSAVVNVFY